MKTFSLGLIAFVVFIGFILVLKFGGGYVGLKYKEFFDPKYQNVERKVFENTKSYVHGKTQDLAKYFEEYNKVDISEQESIRQLILMNFADFDADQIRSTKLRNFLIQMRGY